MGNRLAAQTHGKYIFPHVTLTMLTTGLGFKMDDLGQESLGTGLERQIGKFSSEYMGPGSLVQS